MGLPVHLTSDPEPGLPKWSFIVHYVRLGFSVLLLGLVAYSMSAVNGGFYSYYNIVFTEHIFAIFCFAFSLGTSLYAIISPRVRQGKGWIVFVGLTLECLCVVFWLTSWALLANWASVLSYFAGYAGWGCTAAAAGIGAIIWGLTIALVVAYGMTLHRQIRAGKTGGIAPMRAADAEAHNMQQYAPPPTYTNPGQQQPTGGKQEPQVQQQQYYSPQQQQQHQQQQQYPPQQPQQPQQFQQAPPQQYQPPHQYVVSPQSTGTPVSHTPAPPSMSPPPANVYEVPHNQVHPNVPELGR